MKRIFELIKRTLFGVIVSGALLSFSAIAVAEEVENKGRRNLLAVTPPVLGYSTIDGTIYDALPILFERAIDERLGIRVVPSFVYYRSEFHAYVVSVSLPIYRNAARADSNYYGFYAGPLLGAIERPETRTRIVRVGFDLGYSWPIKNDMQFIMGYSQLFSSFNIKGTGAALTLALGFWF